MRRRVFLSVTGLALACVAAGVIGQCALRTVVNHGRAVSGSNMPSLGVLLEIQGHLGAMRFITARAIVLAATGNAREVGRHWEVREAHRYAVEGALAELSRHFATPREISLSDALRTAYAKFVAENDTVWVEVRAGDLDDAAHTQGAISVRFDDELLEPLEELVDIQRRMTEQAARWSSRAANLASWVLSVIVVAAGVGAAVGARALLRAHGEMQAAHLRLQVFVEHAPAAIAMLDQDLRYLTVSRRWASDNGVAGEDLRGRSHYDVFPDLPARWRAIHARCLQGAVERSEADPFPRQDGTLDWVRWECRPWHREDGSIGGLLLFSEVITESKTKEEALRKSAEKLRLALDAAHMGIWDWDIRSDQVTGTHRFYELLGLHPGEPLRYERVIASLDAADRERVDLHTRTALETKTDANLEMRVLGPNQEVGSGSV